MITIKLFSLISFVICLFSFGVILGIYIGMK